MPATRLTAFAALCLAAPLLAGCGGGPVGGGVANLLAFNTPSPPPTPNAADPNAPVLRSCPRVEVNDGGAALRVGGQANSSVRHQFSLGDVVRECDLANGQIAIRVGVEGRVLLGPTGSPGSYSAPLRISVRRESDQTIAATRTYRVSATIPAGQTGAGYSLVSEPLTVPFLQEYAEDDYTVIVALADGPAERRARR